MDKLNSAHAPSRDAAGRFSRASRAILPASFPDPQPRDAHRRAFAEGEEMIVRAPSSTRPRPAMPSRTLPPWPLCPRRAAGITLALPEGIAPGSVAASIRRCWQWPRRDHAGRSADHHAGVDGRFKR